MLQEGLSPEGSISKKPGSGQWFYLSQEKSTHTSYSNLYLGQLRKGSGLGAEGALQRPQSPLSDFSCPMNLAALSHCSQSWAGTQLTWEASCPVPAALLFLPEENQKEVFLYKVLQLLCQPVPAKTRIPGLSGLGSHILLFPFYPGH